MEHVEAGWYPSARSPDLLQYWDGEMWTERIRPAADTRRAPSLLPPPTVITNLTALTRALHPDEQILAGFRSKVRLRDTAFAATDRRVLVAVPNTLGRGETVVGVEYSQISRVELGDVSSPPGKTGILLVAGSREFRGFDRDLTEMVDFVHIVRLRMAELRPSG